MSGGEPIHEGAHEPVVLEVAEEAGSEEVAEAVAIASPLAHDDHPLSVRLIAGLVAVVGGVSNAFVTNLGAVMSQYTGDPLRTAAIHFAGSTLILLCVFVARRAWRFIKWELLSCEELSGRWWLVPLPGVLGASYVAGGIALTPEVTYGTYIGFFIFGQVAASMLCDAGSVLGAQRFPLTVPRVAVAAIICAAVAFSEGLDPGKAGHAWWATTLMCAAGVACGALAPFQALANKALSLRYGSPFTGALMSFAFGTLWIGLVATVSLAWNYGAASALSEAPWYCWCSGIAGCVFVTTTCVCPRYLGASLYFVSLVMGQLGASLFFDGTRILPNATRAVSLSRALAAVAIAACVVVLHVLHQRLLMRMKRLASSSPTAHTSPTLSRSPSSITPSPSSSTLLRLPGPA